VAWPWRRRPQGDRTRQDAAFGPPLRGPQRAYYQRLTGSYSTVSSNGQLMLTATHVVFDAVIGTGVAVPLADVAGARDQKIRRFHLGGHDRQLVIATRSGDIGFLLKEPAAWAGAISDQLPATEGN
jgi:hypothetical protein